MFCSSRSEFRDLFNRNSRFHFGQTISGQLLRVKLFLVASLPGYGARFGHFRRPFAYKLFPFLRRAKGVLRARKQGRVQWLENVSQTFYLSPSNSIGKAFVVLTRYHPTPGPPGAGGGALYASLRIAELNSGTRTRHREKSVEICTLLIYLYDQTIRIHYYEVLGGAVVTCEIATIFAYLNKP